MIHRDYLIIITGLPRSGTSLLMQILRAGGIPILYDNFKLPDEDNPQGYFEHSIFTQNSSSLNISELSAYKGYAIKIVSPLMSKLDLTIPCKVLFIQRRLEEVILSQEKMLTRRGKKLEYPVSKENLIQVYKKHIDFIDSKLTQNPYVQSLKVSFQELFDNPTSVCETINCFLDGGLCIEAMVSSIKYELYRCK